MFRCMEPLELEILQIKDIKMIRAYKLTNLEQGIPAVAIIYGDNKQLNLSENDDFYNLYIEKILEVYRKQADKENIIMDEETRTLLGNLHIQETRPEVEKLLVFDTAMAKDAPDYSPQSYMDHVYIPIAKYYIGSLYGMFEMHLTFRSAENAWHGKGNILAMRGDAEVHFPYHLYRRSGDDYSIIVGNFFEAGNNLDIRINVSVNGIKVVFDSRLYSMHGVCNYTIDKDTGKLIEDVIINAQGSPLYINTEEVFPLGDEERSKLLAVLNDAGLYEFFKDDWENAAFIRLPWKQIIIYSKRADGTIYSALLTVKNECIHLRNYNYNSVRSAQTGVSLHSSSYITETYVNRKGRNNIQIFFEQKNLELPCSIKESLKNKYFYFLDKIM